MLIEGANNEWQILDFEFRKPPSGRHDYLLLYVKNEMGDLAEIFLVPGLLTFDKFVKDFNIDPTRAISFEEVNKMLINQRVRGIVIKNNFKGRTIHSVSYLSRVE